MGDGPPGPRLDTNTRTVYLFPGDRYEVLSHPIPTSPRSPPRRDDGAHGRTIEATNLCVSSRHYTCVRASHLAPQVAGKQCASKQVNFSYRELTRSLDCWQNGKQCWSLCRAHARTGATARLSYAPRCPIGLTGSAPQVKINGSMSMIQWTTTIRAQSYTAAQHDAGLPETIKCTTVVCY
jgi:hypothetical protein